jgi:hypothetical protein
MNRESTQTSFLLGMAVIVSLFILTWWIAQKRYDCQNRCWECDDSGPLNRNKEGYSPYRNTGGCPNSTGWTYQDSYDQEDWYRKYPYIYPTPTNYYRDWYANRRANSRYLESLRKKMESELGDDSTRFQYGGNLFYGQY